MVVVGVESGTYWRASIDSIAFATASGLTESGHRDSYSGSPAATAPSSMVKASPKPQIVKRRRTGSPGAMRVTDPLVRAESVECLVERGDAVGIDFSGHDDRRGSLVIDREWFAGRPGRLSRFGGTKGNSAAK